MRTLIDNARLWDGERSVEAACIQVDGAFITYAGPRADAPRFSPDATIDARGGIALPGLVNAHTHLPMTLVRGVGTDLPLMDWLHMIWPIEDKLTAELMRLGTQMSALEALRTGTTCFADGYMMSDVIARAVDEAGMRLNVCAMASDDICAETLARQRALYENFNGAGNGRIRVYVGMHAEYTGTEGLARGLGELAAQLGTGLHVHVSETRSEVEECRARHGGRSPVKFLSDAGAFDVPALAAHCVWVDDEDIDILSQKGVTVAHNPVSNLKLASGIAPVASMVSRGVNVALGTDGAASNNSMDMFEELKLAAILQKGATYSATAMSATQALALASQNGARALGFGDVGLIKPGYRADIALLGVANPAHTAARDIPGALVYATGGADVRMTMVDGRVLYMDGEYLTLDEERIRADFAAATGELLGR